MIQTTINKRTQTIRKLKDASKPTYTKYDEVGLLPKKISDAQVSNYFGRVMVYIKSIAYLHK